MGTGLIALLANSKSRACCIDVAVAVADDNDGLLAAAAALAQRGHMSSHTKRMSHEASKQCNSNGGGETRGQGGACQGEGLDLRHGVSLVGPKKLNGCSAVDGSRLPRLPLQRSHLRLQHYITCTSAPAVGTGLISMHHICKSAFLGG